MKLINRIVLGLYLMVIRPSNDFYFIHQLAYTIIIILIFFNPMKFGHAFVSKFEPDNSVEFASTFEPKCQYPDVAYTCECASKQILCMPLAH